MKTESCPKCNGRIIEEDGDKFCSQCFWHIKEIDVKKKKHTKAKVSLRKCTICMDDFETQKGRYCPKCAKERYLLRKQEYQMRTGHTQKPSLRYEARLRQFER